MPSPNVEHSDSADFVGTWTSPRKRAATTLEQYSNAANSSPTGSTTTQPCPHTMTLMRSKRHPAAGGERCPICFDEYHGTLQDRGKIVPVKMGCSHVFCRDCIETHLSSNIKCPVSWCQEQLPLQPAICDLCAHWERNHVETLILTVRAREMTESIKFALKQLASEDHFFVLSKRQASVLRGHIYATLKRFEWQFHSGIDLAELLDPFLLAVDRNAARKLFGAKLSTPAPDASIFPPRQNDPDDYPPGQEPWVAAFLRQWALEYERDNGEVKEGWGVWAKKAEGDQDWEWEWPYKRIMSHKTAEDGKIQYLVKWVGQRHVATWVGEEQLSYEGRVAYDSAHGVIHADEDNKPKGKKARLS